MFTTSRILAFSLLATLASALPATNKRAPKLHDYTEHEAIALVRQATAATVYTACSVPNAVAITFDDGPYTWTTEIVNTLAQYSAKATFFVNGNNYECIYSPENEQRIKTAAAAGHQIASHTWGHLDWTTLSKEKLLSEMTLTDTAIVKLLGVKPAFVRPPFGKYNAASQEVAAANGQSIVIWDFDSGDSMGESATKSEADYQTVANQHPTSILTLNHETYAGTAHTVLPFALQVLQAKGYSFVTVAECLGGLNPYLSATTPAVRDVGYHSGFGI
ncbi:Carbohydrate esterase 4 protein [Tulasnella sp. 424]|nr:Carbohydrate esterase 4 protein [Tulasnella sp. 424]KAG8975940.1 Carbohydrate esterase 4 protein [Tulasnella sp. 425]